jgi:sulfate adenylyltransferase subunit 1 (EFTu-like GTPase family)
MTSPHFGIQYISRVDTFRGLAGTLVNGKFKIGDEIVIWSDLTDYSSSDTTL